MSCMLNVAKCCWMWGCRCRYLAGDVMSLVERLPAFGRICRVEHPKQRLALKVKALLSF